MEPSIEVLIKIVNSAGVTGLLIVGIMAILRGWVILPREYKLCVDEKDLLHKELSELRDRLNATRPLTERAVATAEEVARG